MASNAEMLRLVVHAADKLQEESNRTNNELILSAMAYAEAVLRMVASCLMDDPDPLAPVLAKLTDGTSYHEWSASNPRGMAMADTELDAVSRFMREVGHG